MLSPNRMPYSEARYKKNKKNDKRGPHTLDEGRAGVNKRRESRGQLGNKSNA